jgi:hypothetical protein
VGYYDHERVERSKTFSSASGVGSARDWMRDYCAAERRGPDSLERFLRDLDAQEANAVDGRTLGSIVAMYFALDADPELEGGLARATFASYQTVANGHILGRPMHNNKHEVIGRQKYATWSGLTKRDSRGGWVPTNGLVFRARASSSAPRRSSYLSVKPVPTRPA